MDIFWRLMLGHMLADFTFQTDFVNRWKRTSIWGMLAHCGMHPVCYALLTYDYLGDYWISTSWLHLQGWACILLLFAVHVLEDQWRVMTIFRYKTPDNTLYFLWDQIIHYAAIFAVFPLGLMSYSASAQSEKWAILGCLLVVVTHATTVLAYFMEKDLYGAVFPGFDERYVGMAERLVLWLAFLLPQNGWIIVAPAWVGGMYFLRARRILDMSWFSFGLGTIVTVACGLCARAVYGA